MLDTNVVSKLLKASRLHPRIEARSPASVFMSSLTEAELRYGLAKIPGATRLHGLAAAFFARVSVLPFDAAAARAYGVLRSSYEAQGFSVGVIDGLIAAHAHATGCTLVTHDQALLRLTPWINVEGLQGSDFGS